MRKHLSFFVGIVVGATLFGGSVAYAASGIMATLSNHTIYVDGEQVQMEAYIINGNNYVKMRDIGEAVGFNVYWQDDVQVDSDAAYTGVAPPAANASAGIKIPQSDAKLTLKEGDTVLCDDGTTYTITDMSRYDKSAFAEGPLGDLPEATCDWSSFPVVALPAAEVRHFVNDDGDYMFVRNLYETRRMQYTLQNLAGSNPETSENGKLIYGSKGTPYVQISLTIDNEDAAQVFWPWRESELEKVFSSCPIGTYQVEAWDLYRNGVFQHTRYLIYAM